MVMAADYPLMNIIWTMLVFFAWVMWFYLLVIALGDVFSRHDIGGWTKSLWVVGMLIIPLLGVLIYIGFEGHGMAERRAKDQKAAQSEFDDYVRTVSKGDGSGGAAAEIERAKGLLDAGTIDQAEFDALKAKALAH